MAASRKHILTNIERLGDDAELRKLWQAESSKKNGDVDRTVQQAWAAFIAAADALHIANRIPGSVGRAFKAKYEAEDVVAEVTSSRPKATVKKAPAKPASKTATKKAAGQ